MIGRRMRRLLHVFLVSCMVMAFLPTIAAASGTTAPLPTVSNSGFEDPVSGSAIPGWSETYGLGKNSVHYEVTTAEAYEGTHSLMLEDNSSTDAIGLESDKFPVTPGANYSISAMMNVVTGKMAIYVRYYDGTGKIVSSSASWMDPTSGKWSKNTLTTTVPQNAEQATVLIYSGSINITKAYADDIQIAYAQIGTFKHIGGTVKGMINLDAAIGNEGGKPVEYTVFKGRAEVPTTFAVIDLSTRDVLRSYPMPGVEGAWGVKVATDGRVYIGTHYNGGLYQYTPSDHSFRYIGRFGNETHVFSMVAGANGTIYAGTYPDGKVFEYNPVNNKILDLGQFDPSQKYVRSLAYDAKRNVLYVGVGGTHSRIFKVLPDGTRKELLSTLLPDGGDSYTFPYAMTFANDRLYVKFVNADLMVIRPDDTIEYYNPGKTEIFSGSATPIPGEPRKAVYSYMGDLYVYDSATQSVSLWKKMNSPLNFDSGAFVNLINPQYPGTTFVGVGNYGQIEYYNLSTGKTDVQPANYSGAPILIQSIHQGPDGKIYTAGYMSGFSSYDPVTGKISKTHTLGQIESSAIRNGKMLLGAYTQARVLEYDPSQPWSDQNPHQLFDLSPYGQDRPFTMAYAKDKDLLFVGTVPAYDSLQGALSMYNFSTKQLDVFKNIVPNQSVISLVYKDGLVYAGTTVYGGLGTSGPTATSAELFIFDPVTKKKVFETVPVPGRKGITGLHVGPDGMIWGIAEDYIFKFDPKTRKIVYKASKLRRYPTTGTTWKYGYMQTGGDGNIYGTSRGQFFMINPNTMQFQLLNSSMGDYLTTDRYGNLYFSDDNTDLWEYTPPKSDMTPPVTTANLSPTEPNGSNDWYVTPVTISLSASDPDSSVDESVYSIDGGDNWKVYTDPISITQDGKYQLMYHSIDVHGNLEKVKTSNFQIDQTPPTIKVNVPSGSTYADDENLTVQASVYDTLSGVDSSQTTLAIDGQQLTNGSMLPLYTLPLGPHTLSISAADLAGNKQRSVVHFNTTTNLASLEKLIDIFTQTEAIDNKGIANSLIAKLNEASIQAFINEVEAQKGKHISGKIADILIRDAKYLL